MLAHPREVPEPAQLAILKGRLARADTEARDDAVVPVVPQPALDLAHVSDASNARDHRPSAPAASPAGAAVALPPDPAYRHQDAGARQPPRVEGKRCDAVSRRYNKARMLKKLCRKKMCFCGCNTYSKQEISRQTCAQPPKMRRAHYYFALRLPDTYWPHRGRGSARRSRCCRVFSKTAQ